MYIVFSSSLDLFCRLLQTLFVWHQVIGPLQDQACFTFPKRTAVWMYGICWTKHTSLQLHRVSPLCPSHAYFLLPFLVSLHTFYDYTLSLKWYLHKLKTFLAVFFAKLFRILKPRDCGFESRRRRNFLF